MITDRHRTPLSPIAASYNTARQWRFRRFCFPVAVLCGATPPSASIPKLFYRFFQLFISQTGVPLIPRVVLFQFLFPAWTLFFIQSTYFLSKTTASALGPSALKGREPSARSDTIAMWHQYEKMSTFLGVFVLFTPNSTYVQYRKDGRPHLYPRATRFSLNIHPHTQPPTHPPNSLPHQILLVFSSDSSQKLLSMICRFFLRATQLSFKGRALTMSE